MERRAGAASEAGDLAARYGTAQEATMALSDQLMDLAGRTKRLEDSAAAAQARNRAKLEEKQEKLHSTLSAEAQDLNSSTTEAGTEVRSWWADTTANIEQWRAGLEAKRAERKAERKVEKAERDAEDAEDYAASLVSYAAYAIDAAEYAVVDAAIARGDADELAAAN
jgi:hypothetical protein